MTHQFELWLTVGAILIAAEIAMGAFVLLFFGLGAALTSLLPLLGYENFPLQCGFFAVASVAMLIPFRKVFIARFQPAKSNSSDTGEEFFLDVDIAEKDSGTITYQGSPWTAINAENFPLFKGVKVRIEKTEGVKLFLRKA